MRPALSRNNSADFGLMDMKPSTDGPLRFTAFNTSANLAHARVRQNSMTHFAAAVLLAILGFLVADVVCLGSEKQVSGIDAARHIAFVENAQAAWDRSNEKFVRDPMRTIESPLVPEPAIAESRPSASPQVTIIFIRRKDKLSESAFNRHEAILRAPLGRAPASTKPAFASRDRLRPHLKRAAALRAGSRVPHPSTYDSAFDRAEFRSVSLAWMNLPSFSADPTHNRDHLSFSHENIMPPIDVEGREIHFNDTGNLRVKVIDMGHRDSTQVHVQPIDKDGDHCGPAIVVPGRAIKVQPTEGK